MSTSASAQPAAVDLETKIAQLCTTFSQFDAPEPEVFTSPAQHYRQRAEFRFWHEGNDGFYAMFDPGAAGEPRRVDHFPAASQRINTLMVTLREALLHTPALKSRLFQVEFLDTLAGETLLTLVYHRRLDAVWEDAARTLAKALGVRIIGRSRGQRIAIGEDFVTERLQVDGRELVLRQPEGCFTQPNAEVNRAMLTWARRVCARGGSGLVELYCGIGNFTVAIAEHFETVLATEVNKVAIAAAAHNLVANGIENTFIARLSGAETSAALARTRPFRRLRGFDLERFAPDTVLVDPPRAGLDAHTLTQVACFERIVYISCNPHTLHENLRALATTHRIEGLAVFDQFPQTPHLECGVSLERRTLLAQ